MQWRVLVANVVVFSAMAAMALSGTRKDTAKVLPALPAHSQVAVANLSALEGDAARDPSIEHIGALSAAYLERNQPGLASAAIDKAPADVKAAPEIAYLSARAHFLRGNLQKALASAEQVQQTCGEKAGNANACPAWLVAKTERQLAFFRGMNALGIENPYTNPELTRAAYERSQHEIRTVALR